MHTTHWLSISRLVLVGLAFHWGVGYAADNQIQGALLKNAAGKFELAQVLDNLSGYGYRVFDLEQGQFSPEFDEMTIKESDPLGSLQSLLATQGYGCEMHGQILVIYDKALRTMKPDGNPLNLKIPYLRLEGVSLQECFAKLASTLKVTILVGDPVAVRSDSPLRPFSVELKNVTLREALFQIVEASKARIWNASVFTLGSKRVLEVSIN